MLLILIQQRKDLSIDFLIRLSIFTNWKGETYDLILGIIDQLPKIVYYKLVKVTIDASGLAKVIFNIIVLYHGLQTLILIDCGSVFISKFWSSLYYFLVNKQKLSTIFYLEIDSQTKQQNSTMETSESLSITSKTIEILLNG